MTTFGTRPTLGLAGLVCLMISIFTAGTAAADEIDPTLPVLTWQHGDLANADGSFTLSWSPSTENGDYDFVRIEANNLADGEGNWHPHFVVGDSQAFASYAQGERQYRLRACVITEDDSDSCGALSDTISVTSSAAVETARPVRLRSSLPEPDPAQVNSVPGGAAEVNPGIYVTNGKRRTGWNLHWVNDLRCRPVNPDGCLHDNVNQLWITWNTYRDFSQNAPGQQNLQPVWLMGGLRAVNGNPNLFTGSLHYIRIENYEIDNDIIGTITLERGINDPDTPPAPSSRQHRVTWSVSDASFYHDGIADQEVIDYLTHQTNYDGVGVTEAPNEIDHFQGWWFTPSTSYVWNKFNWISYITGNFEFGVLSFFDGQGEPIWGTAQWGGYHSSNPFPPTAPPIDESLLSFCVFTVIDGWYPDSDTPTGHAFSDPLILQNPNRPTGPQTPCTLHPGDGQGAGWNLKRRYGPLEADDPEAHGQPGGIVLKIDVPEAVRGPDAVRSFDYGNGPEAPWEVHKWVSNHVVRYFFPDDPNEPNPSACEMQDGACQVLLDWFSDGYYPQATLYRFKKSGDDWEDPHRVTPQAGWPVTNQFSVKGYSHEIDEPGIYRFELRRHVNDSQLIAFTPDLEVFEAQSPGTLSITPESYDFGNILPNERIFKVFILENTGPAGSSLEISDYSASGTAYTVLSQGTTCNNAILGSGDSCTVRVRFQPPSASAYNDETLSVTSAAGSVNANLSGQGVLSCGAGVTGAGALLEAVPGDLPVLEFANDVLADTPGVFELAWTDKQLGAGEPDIYVLTRISTHAPDEQPTLLYSRESHATVAHYVPGTWRYTAQACVFDGDSRRCGSPSEPLIVHVSHGPTRGRQPVPRSSLPEPEEQPQSSPPSLLGIGQYKSGLTKNNGWYFSWDSLLRDENNPQDKWELKAVWATYRDFNYPNSASSGENLQPVWLTADLLPHGGGNVYKGDLLYTIVNANGIKQDIDVGNVTVCLDTQNQGAPRVEWEITEDRSFYESGQARTVIDELEHLYIPPAGAPTTNDIDHYQGLWDFEPPSGLPLDSASVFNYTRGVVETNLLMFFDHEGEPIWGASQWRGQDSGALPSADDTKFCVYGVRYGWYPDVSYPEGRQSDLVPYGYGASCQNDVNPNWNLRRQFDELPQGIAQTAGVVFSVWVPPFFRGQEKWLVHGGVNPNGPVYVPMHKAAGFHGIRYPIGDSPADPVNCVLSDPGGCNPVLRWFSGGNYSQAHLFIRQEVDDGPPSLTPISGWSGNSPHSYNGLNYSITEPGTYSFELYEHEDPGSRLLTRTPELNVFQGCQDPEFPPALGFPTGILPESEIPPFFVWNSVGAQTVDLLVWREDDPDTILIDEEDYPSSGYQSPDDGRFVTEVDYEWRITARHPDWCNEQISFEGFRFECAPPPEGPSLHPVQLPADNEPTPTFAWKGVSGAESYELCIWHGGEFETGNPFFCEDDITDVTYQVTDDSLLQMYVDYEWQIVAYNEGIWCGDTTASDPASFRLEPPPINPDPDLPPAAPAPDPGFTADPESSRVGATAGQFRIDESGAANYSIPIMTVPGSGGVEPEISLNYNSHGGRGPLGQGWSLSGFSTISRCGQTIEQDGATTGIRLDGQDRFCLDGQKLMLVPGTGAYGTSGSQYRLEIDDFSRITAHGNLNGSPTHFEVRRKDGSLSTYGTPCHPALEDCSPSPSARVLTKGADPVVFAWPISRFEDSVGNFIEYLYDHPDPSWIEWVPLAVLYTGHELYNEEPFASIQFVHIDLENPPAKAGAVDTRPDEPVPETEAETGATTGFVAGQKVRSTRLLDFIDSVSKNDKDEDELIRRYHLHYVEDAFGRPLLKRVRECGGTATEICFDATEFNWISRQLAIDDPGHQSHLLNVERLHSAQAGDLTGDGRQEVVVLFGYASIDQPRFRVIRNPDPTAPTLHLSADSPVQSRPLASGIERKDIGGWTLADLDANGRMGAAYAAWCNNENHCNRGIYYHAPDPDDTPLLGAADQIGDLPQDINFHKPRITAVDHDGDGLSDLVLTDAEELDQVDTRLLWVYRSESQVNGNVELSDPVPVTGIKDMFTEDPLWCHYDYTFRTFESPLADVDTSGRVALVGRATQVKRCPPQPQSDPLPERFTWDELEDFMAVRGGEGWTREEKHITGLFQLNDSGDTITISKFGTTQFNPKDIVIPADINGDGLTDFVVLKKQLTGNKFDVEVHHNRGREGIPFHPSPTGLNDLEPELVALVRVLDYTGNGHPDFLIPRKYPTNSYAYWTIHPWRPDDNGGTFDPAPIPSLGPIAGKIDHLDGKLEDLTVFADLYGNGKNDIVGFFRRAGWNNSCGDSGGGTKYCIFAGEGGSEGDSLARKDSRYLPDNRITTITDGFGAWTRIEYKSLAQRSVYTRDNFGPHTGWGNGSVVYDVVMPMYVVSAAESLAPQVGSGNTTRVEYYYEGAKLQGGGRGMLGFRDIASYDLNSRILTRTEYWQAFPRTGLPRSTLTSYQPGHKWPESDNTENVDWCLDDEYIEPIDPDPQPMGIDPGTGESCMPRGINPGPDVLGLAKNTWAVLSTVTRHPYLEKSEEWSFTPESNFNGVILSRVFTHSVVTENNNLDAWGNPGEVVVSTYTGKTESSSFELVARQTTVNEYDPSRLPLGRLTCARVTSERPGELAQTRISTFDYHLTTGILKRETIGASHCDDAVGALTTTYIPDDFGNREETRVTGDGIDRRSRNVYDSKGRFVNSKYVWIDNSWQATRIIEEADRDRYGNPTEVTDGRGVVTKQYYDHMGRPYYTYTSDGAWSRVLYTVDFDPLVCPTQTAYLELQETAGGEPIVVNSDTMRLDGGNTQICRDRLGRQTRTRTRAFNSGWNHVDTDYDYASRVARVSEPYHCPPQQQCEEVYLNRTTYDIAGQAVRLVHADGETETWKYNGLTTKHTNQRGKVHAVTTNPMGEKVMEIAADEGVTLYDYDALGQLTETDGPLPGTQDLITIGYDALGHKLWMDDPDKGYWQYRHNALGELRCQKDAEGRGVKMNYDDLGRLEKRWDFSFVNNLEDCTGTEAGISEWTYGDQSGIENFGQVTKEQSDFNNPGPGGTIDPIVVPQGVAPGPSRAFERDFHYDAYGRVEEVVTRIDDGGAVRTYTEATTYDEFSRVFQQFDASGDSRGLRYHYNPRGYVLSLQEAREGEGARTYWSVLEQDARGNVTEALLGNGITVHATHDPATGRLMDLQTSGGQELAQNLALEWDVIGNLMYRYDYSAGPAQLECFQYDDRDRLQEVKHPANINQACESVTPSFISVDYDKSGNITYKSDVGSYSYGSGNAGPHAVTSAGGRTFQYDDVGNVVSDSLSRTYHYTTFNQLRSVTRGGNSTYFYYGPNRKKVIKHDQQGSTHYVGNVEIARADGPAGSREYRRYIGGVALVTFEAETGNTRQRYLHKDHLGSVTAITDESGYVVARMAYDPWGQRRNPEDLSQSWEQWTQQTPPNWAGAMRGLTPRGYTGHEQVDDHGVVLMGARVYDPRLGRFLQADPFVEDATTLNRYTYVHNNPLAYTDPSGYLSIKEVVTIAAVVVVSVYTGGAAAGAWSFFGTTLTTGQAFAAVVAAGAISGGISTGTWEGAAWGAFSAAAFYGIGQAFAGVADPTGGGIFNTGLNGTEFAMQSLSHGVVGGMISHMQGGKFGHGFISAGVSKVSTPAISTLGNAYAEGVAAAIVGGTTSRLTGGKFENGATTAAMAYAFNQLASSGDGDGYRQYDPEDDSYHDASMLVQMCDAAQQFGCSPEYVYHSGLKYHPAPGFDGSAPIRHLDVREVPGLGDVRFHVFDDELKIVNATMPGHRLHPGYVERQVIQVDQRVYIRTHGVGIGAMSNANVAGMPIVWPAVDAHIARSLHGIYPPTRISR